MVFLFIIVGVSFCYNHAARAQNQVKPSEAPALVVPKQEAADAGSSNKEVPPLSTSDKDDNGSLSGAFLSSYVAHSEGNLTQALHYLNDAYERDPTNARIASQVLILNITLGEIPRALEIAKQLKAAGEHELIVDLLLAVDAVKNNQLDEARNRLSTASTVSFDHIWLPLLLEWMPSKTQQSKPVNVSDIIKEKGIIPTFVHYHVALLNDLKGFNNEAEQHYQLATNDLARAPFRALLAYVNMLLRTDQRELAQQIMLDLRQQRPDIEALLRAEQPSLNDLAAAPSEPVKPFIANSQQGTAEVLLTMASMLYTLDISQDIPLYLQMAIYLRPDFPTAQLMLGNYFESLELWDEALLEYQAIRPTSPLYIKSAIRRIHVLEMTDQKEAATTLAHQLTQQFPNSLEAWVAAADLERGRSNFQAAITYYDKAIALLNNAPTNEHWFLYFARGASYERLGKITEAERDLRQARNLAPKQPEVLNYIGYMWLDRDEKVHEAVALIANAYALSPNEPHIMDSMGLAFYKTGKLDEAIAMLENAAEYMPNDPTINEHLGDAYWQKERILEARFQWNRAKDFSEDEKEKSRLEDKINNGLETYSFHTPLIGKPASKAPSDNKTNSPNHTPEAAKPAPAI